MFKLSFESETTDHASLYERADTWNEIDESFEIDKERNLNFVQFYQQHGTYPQTEFVLFQPSEHETENEMSANTNTNTTTNVVSHSNDQQEDEISVIENNEDDQVNTVSEQTQQQIGERQFQKAKVEVTTRTEVDKDNVEKDKMEHVEIKEAVYEEEDVDEEEEEEPDDTRVLEDVTKKPTIKRILQKKMQLNKKTTQLDDIRLMFNAQHTIAGNNKILRKNRNYVWVIDTDCNFIFCDDKQDNFAMNRNSVKHGDLTATGTYLLGSVENMSAGRGPARMGGEFKWNISKKTWTIDNDSSYCFFRDDNLVISNTLKVKWQNYVNKLLRSFGIETDDIIWLDLVKSRKLDSFVVQKISLAYKKYSRGVDTETVLKQNANQKSKLINLFRGVNLLSIVFGAFGAQVFFMTEGLLNVKIIEAKNLPNPGVLKLTSSNPYVELSIRGCDKTMDEVWWKKSQKTSVLSRTQTPIWNETLQMYVTSHQVEIIDFCVYHKQLDPLQPLLLAKGSLELDEIDLEKLITSAEEEDPRTQEIWLELEPIVSNLSLTSNNQQEETPTNAQLIRQPRPRSRSILSSATIPKLRVEIGWVPHIQHEPDQLSFVKSYSMLKSKKRQSEINHQQQQQQQESDEDNTDSDTEEIVLAQ
jgi:hypothetical protein